ncbi:MAG: sigma factor [Prosthecobacter sp.]|uniref:RNA polymerase sigma factor n=1 Tax=Prosthecobacter sp. TaxID=1965333 RepID=UPI003BAFF65C
MSDSLPDFLNNGVNGDFTDTQHTNVRLAVGGDLASIRKLVIRYWKPLYLFALRQGLKHEDAADVVQEMSMDLSKTLQRFDLQRGRLRTFLIKALINKIYERHRRATAAKRGGPSDPTYSLENISPDDPSLAVCDTATFDQDWVINCWRNAVAAIIRRVNPEHWLRLKQFLIHRPPPPGAYERLAAETGDSREAWTQRFSRLSNMFYGQIKNQVRQEIRTTASSAEELDAELAYISRVAATMPAEELWG